MFVNRVGGMNCRFGHYVKHGDHNGRSEVTDFDSDQGIFEGDIGGVIAHYDVM